MQAEANGSSASNQTRAGASDIRSTLAGTSNAQTHSSGTVAVIGSSTRWNVKTPSPVMPQLSVLTMTRPTHVWVA